MNPSLYINEDGTFILLVRTINYLKYKNKAFTIYGNSSNSIYSIMRGTIENEFSLDTCDVKNVDVQYTIPRHHSLWYGIEDIRFIDSHTILACIPECNNSSPCIFKGVLNDTTITSFEKCSPSQVEKNWMPFKDGETSKVIYSMSPFIIKSILYNDKTIIHLSELQNEELKGWHGSTNGIPFMDQTLFLIHKNKDRVVNRWLLFNSKTNQITLSTEFVFFNHSFLEFACSLCEYKDTLFVSVGINDNRAFIIEVDKEEVLKMVPPL